MAAERKTMNVKRRFIDAPNAVRCQAEITLPDGSKAQCGRRRVIGGLCKQHAKMESK